MVFCNMIPNILFAMANVTILILIDGFLQLETPLGMVHHKVKSQSLF